MPSAASFFAGLGADPPQRVGRPLPHHLEPVVPGQLPDAARLAEVGRDLGAQLVVADPDRAVQPGRGQHLGLDPLGEVARVAEVAVARARPPGTPRPSRAPRAPPGRRPTPATAASPSPRAEASSYAGPSTGRNTASGHLRSATRSGMPEPTPNSRAAYDAVDTTPRSVGSPRPPTTTGSPASSGWRRISTAAMNWSRSTCSTHCWPAGVSRPRLVAACPAGRPV